MKLIIEFKDGHTEVVEDAMPNFSPDHELGPVLTGMDNDCGLITDDVPLNVVKRVVWEND